MMPVVLTIQVATFVGLALLFYDRGDWRLGTAQLLLAVVQAVIYTGRMAA